MGERYWVSGVQLGLMVAGSEENRKATVDEIIDKQFLGNTHDLKIMKKVIK